LLDFRGIRIALVVIVFAFMGAAVYFASTKDQRDRSALKACQQKCAPRFGEINGEPRIPNSSPLERRYSEVNVKCVCN
jgi:hypothetical protein